MFLLIHNYWANFFFFFFFFDSLFYSLSIFLFSLVVFLLNVQKDSMVNIKITTILNIIITTHICFMLFWISLSMFYWSCSDFMLSSIFHHRFILIISILLFNPLPLIIGAPTSKTNAQFKLIRQKRQISVNNHDIVNNPNVFPLDGEINFEGLLGLINSFL